MTPQNRSHVSYSSRFTGDGTFSGSADSGDDGGDCIVPLDSTIYVSIFDPLGESAFKPSPTKPIPRWMRWLPSQRGRGREREARHHSLLDEHLSREAHSIHSPSNSRAMLYTYYPTSSAQSSQRSKTPPRRQKHYHKPEDIGFSNLTNSTIKALKGPSFVSDEPLKRPSSRIVQSAPDSPRTATGELFITPPNPQESMPPRTHTAYAPRRLSPLATHKSQPGSEANPPPRETAEPPRSTSPLTDQVAAHIQRYVRRTPPAQSREFLNLYHTHKPASKCSPSIAISGRERTRQMGDGRQIRDILGRERSPSGEPVVMAAEGGEMVDARSMRKRSSLQGELKKLFGGRGGGGVGRR